MLPLFLAVATATTSVFALGGARIHPASDTSAVRAQIGLARSLWDSAPYALVVEVDAAFAAAARGEAQGDVRIFLVSGTLGLEARQDFSSLSVGIGPRLELGWGLAEGSSSSEQIEDFSGNALVAAASLGVSLRVPIALGLGVSVLGEAGYTLRGLEALVDGASSLGWRGAFVSATAGLWLDL